MLRFNGGREKKGLWTSTTLAHAGHNQVIPTPAPEAPVGLMTPLESSTAPFSLGSHSPLRSCSRKQTHVSAASAPTNTSGDVATSPELGLGRGRPSPLWGLSVSTPSVHPLQGTSRPAAPRVFWSEMGMEGAPCSQVS